ncbi:DUF6970 domain-containing protein [Hymenobacter rubripertinctus]|uniref:DUF6970 domain-containing protein n=1 Tax=Hymenobacter rubripertinctus TaxID=2029981 RepID=A0A418QQ63_9BACT|nr:hypothetical protein [Hymenobacter rubripertinctus]RIY07356.1 hypothetical protein D0T11_16655 [Hymenobacter rubripertinctus]
MNRLLLMLALGTFGLAACQKGGTSAEPGPSKQVPACIKDKTAAFAREALCKTAGPIAGASVQEYTFQKRLVYVFSPGTCRANMTFVYDAACHDLGGLGGVVGNRNINGEPFANATFERTIWQQ